MYDRPLPIRVLPLTPDIVRALSRDAARALHGDGSCSLNNMRTSCFASETCAGGGDGASVRLETMLRSKRAFVAVLTNDERHADAPLHYVGSLTVDPISRYSFLFPKRSFHSEAIVFGNFCVAEAYRRHGVGHMLLQRGLQEVDDPTKAFLLVARWGLVDPNPEVVDVFRDRVARLKTTYARMNFAFVCENSQCMLMQCRR